ncbi:hypothetical protein DMUE_5002 [Dictyocoela muelleri]|nr:hypothetical protein DMUE_5002 [Dictyocoela muelleri]
MFSYLNINTPSESTIRNGITTEYLNHLKKILDMFNNKKFLLIADEVQINGNKFINIIIASLENPNFKISCNVKKINGSVNSQKMLIVIDDSIKELCLFRENFLLLLTDSTRYMMLCEKNLKLLYPNMLHVTCFMHILHNCANKIRIAYPNVEYVIASVKQLVHKNIRKKTLFGEIGNPPQPILTIWGTWLDAIFYYAENFEEVKEIILEMSENGVLLSNATAAISQENVRFEIFEICKNIVHFVMSYFQVYVKISE